MEWRRLLCVFVALETTILSPGASYSSPTSPPQLSSPSTSPPQLSLPSTSPPQLSSALNTNTSLASSSSHSHKGDSASSLTTLPPVVNTGDLQLPSNDQVVERQWSLVPKIERVTSHKPPVTSLPLLRRKKSVCSYDVTVKSREVKEVHEITGSVADKSARSLEAPVGCDPLSSEVDDNIDLRELRGRQGSSYFSDNSLYGVITQPEDTPANLRSSYFSDNSLYGVITQPEDTPANLRSSYFSDNSLYGVIAQPEDTPANLRSSYFSNNSL
ncbi:hypothetical protein Hamer_G021377 [Homarus americanus]|uniref:Uncharacterized protein n=1 Tax=Homarus americanus TaxID=6706 RepID=A0A8J5JLW4_HOMAM|nr:hypothetical protein Hamer_G021377 [Homarus americanus]